MYINRSFKESDCNFCDHNEQHLYVCEKTAGSTSSFFLFYSFYCNLRKWAWQYFWVISASESSLCLYKLPVGQRDVVKLSDLVGGLLV